MLDCWRGWIERTTFRRAWNSSQAPTPRLGSEAGESQEMSQAPVGQSMSSDHFGAGPLRVGWLGWDILGPWKLFISVILLMEEILHQLISSFSHYLQGFMHVGWCRISSINSIMGKWCRFSAFFLLFFGADESKKITPLLIVVVCFINNSRGPLFWWSAWLRGYPYMGKGCRCFFVYPGSPNRCDRHA